HCLISDKEYQMEVLVTSAELIEKIDKTRASGFKFIHRMELNKNLAFVSINLSCVTSILLTYYVNCGIIKGLDNSLLSHFSFIVTIISFIFSLIISSMNYQGKIDSTKLCNRKLNLIRDQVYANQTGNIQSYIDLYHNSFNSVESHHKEIDYEIVY